MEIRSGDKVLVNIAPYGGNSSVFVNGQNISGMVSGVVVECNAADLTRLTITIPHLVEGQVAGRLVLDAEWEQFAMWRKQQEQL